MLVILKFVSLFLSYCTKKDDQNVKQIQQTVFDIKIDNLYLIHTTEISLML